MTNLIQICRNLFCHWKKCRRTCLSAFLIFILGLATSPDLYAEITWHETETEFDYSIKNLSYFVYSLNQYYNDYNDYDIRDEASASYGSVAEIQVSEFDDIPLPGSGIQIEGMAKGPTNGIDPPNGLMVQAFLSTVAEGLTNQQGADIDLEAVSRIVRRFEVNLQEDYNVKVELTGLADYDEFYTSDQYRAAYSIETEVKLEQIVGTGEQMVVQTMPGFPVNLDESNRRALVAVQLQPYDDQLRAITYRIKAELKLKSRIDNLTLSSWTVAGDVNGNYMVGSSQAPFMLKALLKPAGLGMPPGSYLLLLSN